MCVVRFLVPMVNSELKALRKAVDDMGGVITFDEDLDRIGAVTVLLGETVSVDTARRILIDALEGQ